MNEWMKIIPQFLSPWVYAPLAFLSWLLIGFIVRRNLIAWLRGLAKRTPFKLDDLFVESLPLPFGILIFGSGIAWIGKLLPLAPEFHRIAAICFQTAVVFAAIFLAERFLTGLVASYSDKIQAGISPKAIESLIRLALIMIGAMILLDLMGISVTPLLASLGIGSLAVALPLQDTLSNFFAGLYVSIEKPIRVADFVRLESGEEGYVTEIGWRNTKIKTPQDNLAVVPNSKIASGIVLNYHLPAKELAVPIPVGVHYNSNLEHVERVTVDVAREIMKKIPGAVPRFDPVVRYHAFDNSSINFNVVLRAKEFADQGLIKHEFVKALHARYQKEGIVISFPTRTIDFEPKTLETLRDLFKR